MTGIGPVAPELTEVPNRSVGCKSSNTACHVWNLSSSAASCPQFNSNKPRPSFLVSALSRSEELCLFLSIFSLYLPCSSYRGRTSPSLCFPPLSLCFVLILPFILFFVFTSFNHFHLSMSLSPLVHASAIIAQVTAIQHI